MDRRMLNLLGALLLIVGCSDSGPAVDAAVDLRAPGLEAGAADLSSDGAAPGFPKNLTQFVNLGDSLAVGYPATSGHSYRELLQKNDDVAYPGYKGRDLTTLFPGIKVVNSAVVGATAPGLVKQVQGLTGNPGGDTLVVISIGGNDFAGAVVSIALNPAGGTAALTKNVTNNLKQVFAHFADRTKYPGQVQIVFFVVHDPTDAMGTIPAGFSGLTGFCVAVQALGGIVGPSVAKQLALFNASVASFVRSNKGLVADNYTRFLGHGYHHKNAQSKHYEKSDPSLWFVNDCLHANDRGYDQMRQVVWKRITGF